MRQPALPADWFVALAHHSGRLLQPNPHRPYFCILREALARRDFGAVWLVLQCF